MGQILITALRASGTHGVLAEEQARPQPFEVDIELEVDTTVAGETDEIEDTVDYAAVIDSVERVITQERYALLERLATRIGALCRADDRVTRATITVRKLRPPVPALLDHVGVRVTV